MKTFDELTKEEKMLIMEALIDGQEVEVVGLYYSNNLLLRGWLDFTLPIKGSMIFRIKDKV